MEQFFDSIETSDTFESPSFAYTKQFNYPLNDPGANKKTIEKPKELIGFQVPFAKKTYQKIFARNLNLVCDEVESPH